MELPHGLGKIKNSLIVCGKADQMKLRGRFSLVGNSLFLSFIHYHTLIFFLSLRSRILMANTYPGEASLGMQNGIVI